MSRRPLIYDVVHVRYHDPESGLVIDQPAVIEDLAVSGWYETLFLDHSVYGVEREHVQLIPLSTLTPSQIEVALQIKVELLDRFFHEVGSGHLVRDAEGKLLVLGESIDPHTFQAIDLNTKTERIVLAADCTRVLPFELPFAERLEFEELSQMLCHEAARQELPGDLRVKLCELLEEWYPDDEATQERRLYGVMRHWLYLRFPDYAEREFAGREELAREWLVDDDPSASGLAALVEEVISK